MIELDYKLEDFPDNPEDMNWDKEATLFYHYMINQEDKFEQKIQEIIAKFKKILAEIPKQDVVKRKTVFNELKNEVYQLKNKDPSLKRILGFVLLTHRILRDLENSVEKKISKQENLKALQEIISSDAFKEEIEAIEENNEDLIDKAANEITRLTRTESWRSVNEQRLEEFRKKGYKYKTTYPVKDNRTCADSWYYYDQRQIKPIDEPFNYTWDGKERVFMTPPDRPNDRNILIPYVGDPNNFHNKVE